MRLWNMWMKLRELVLQVRSKLTIDMQYCQYSKFCTCSGVVVDKSNENSSGDGQSEEEHDSDDDEICKTPCDYFSIFLK